MTFQRDIILQEVLQVEPNSFDQLALQIFDYQATHNELYKSYLSLIKVNPKHVKSIKNIPFLPISFFKTQRVKTVIPKCKQVGGPDMRSNWRKMGSRKEVIFSSSGTTRDSISKHYLSDLDFYKQNTVLGFEAFYGYVEDHCILGLLPSYLERSGSSLIAMVNHFIQLSKHPKSDFFLYDHANLAIILQQCKKEETPTLLIGVSFALLDFAEKYSMDLAGVIIMETGGMKGRRKEITRTALHTILKKAFQVDTIHSEYGMTELLSQGYSKGNGFFYPSPTMKVLTREITDPFSFTKIGKTGVINIIDLANIDSCAFIATDDLGKVYPDGGFEILGRLDSSDIRGCNLMVL